MRYLVLIGLLLTSSVILLEHQGTFALTSDSETGHGEFHAADDMGGVHDPGHAYEDADNNGRYDEDTDTAIPDPDIHDGRYTVTDPGHGLVIPRSVGTIEPDGPIEFASGAQSHLIVEVKLESPETITLDAGTDAELTDLLAEADQGIDIVAGQDILLTSARLEALDEIQVSAGDTLRALRLVAETPQPIELEATSGSALITESTLETSAYVRVDAGQDIRANQARIQTGEHVHLIAGQDVHVKQATLEAGTHLVLHAGSTSDAIYVQDARLLDENNTARAEPSGVEVVGTPAEGSIDYKG